MRRKKRHTGLIIFCILLIVAGIFIYKNIKNKSSEENDKITVTEANVEQMTILNTINSSSYIASVLTENIELHATYYFDEIYYEENELIKEGENILKYTNGKYLVAPYDCIITKIEIPDKDEKCTNSHYITIESTNVLTMSLNVDEDELDTVYIGQEAEITVDVLKDKSYTGYVTKISNTASYSSNGSKFTVIVEFKNDGNILIGMGAKCNIILEKAENVISVPSEAIITENKKKYVTIKKDDEETEKIEVQTGISNDAYTEIKSDNLEVGQIVLIEKNNSSSKKEFSNNRGGDMLDGMDFDFESKSGGSIPSMEGGKMPDNFPSMSQGNEK